MVIASERELTLPHKRPGDRVRLFASMEGAQLLEDAVEYALSDGVRTAE